jgi:flavodoxin
MNTTPASQSSTKVLVAYESHGGHTRRTAEAIAEAARTEGCTVAVRPLAQIGPDDLRDWDVLFLGTWVEGFIFFGAKPARAARRWLKNLPDLKGKAAAVFCSYAFNPSGTLPTLRSSLEARAAKVVGEQAFQRRRPEQGAAEFARTALAAAKSSLAGR